MGSVKQEVSEDLRKHILDLRRRHSFREVAHITGLPLGTVKTVVSRSGAFRDNEAHRKLFCLPSIRQGMETYPSVPELPSQQAVTGDREVDALLWLRDVISTGQAGAITAAMEAAQKIKTPLKQLEARYRDHLRTHRPGDLFAALSSFDLGDLQALADKSIEKVRRQAEAQARFGDRIFSHTDAEVFCISALDGLQPTGVGSFDSAEVSTRFKARPELMPNTLSDCLYELEYWNQLYWLRHAVERDGSDPAPEASARGSFVFELLARIRPRSREEAKAVLRYLVAGDRGDADATDQIMENLLG